MGFLVVIDSITPQVLGLGWTDRVEVEKRSRVSRLPRDLSGSKPSRAELLGSLRPTVTGRVTHGSVLTLHTGAVETQGRYSLLAALDVQDALVASLSRLRLWEVLSLQSDGFYHLNWYQDLVHS